MTQEQGLLQNLRKMLSHSRKQKLPNPLSPYRSATNRKRRKTNQSVSVPLVRSLRISPAMIRTKTKKPNDKQNDLSMRRGWKVQGTCGFTLLELMVVVALVGILTAIAVPQYAIYRGRAADAQAKSDLRNAAVSQESHYLTNGSYVTCSDAGCETNLPNFRRSETVSISLTAVTTGGAETWTGDATSNAGTRSFTWDSNTGGLVN